ncbi:hypothetical protein KLP40_01080 [Hymenobacter sp. NST-14]|uniref:hypothetical protein n=1 Tax=Hymenobacter piscis TaxID=2839984 RepID=UPI001C00E97F|nr:hypothetical protein [Hymenobacter piscis]MBT9391740.1 hypothetical protein [Hymenobacter piscis]
MRYATLLTSSLLLLLALGACTAVSERAPSERALTGCEPVELSSVLNKDWYNTLAPKDADGFETYKLPGTFEMGMTTGFQLGADSVYTIHSFGPADEPLTIRGSWHTVSGCPPIVLDASTELGAQQLRLELVDASTLKVKFDARP